MSYVIRNHRFVAASVALFATLFVGRMCTAQCDDIFAYSDPAPATVMSQDLQGAAALVDAWGRYDVNEGQAEILGEQARTLRSDNNLKESAALLQQQKMWDDARYQKRKDSEARQAEGRKILEQRRATIYRETYSLPASQLDLSTGSIVWPTALKTARFDAHRAQLEELFRQHVGYGSPESNKSQEITRSIDAWSHSLRSEISSMSREDYISAQKFLMGLKYGAASMVKSA